MSGLAVGTSIGPVIGGILYDKLGWNAPFIFCIGCCVVDFIGRLLVIERKDLPAECRRTLSALPADVKTNPSAPPSNEETEDVKDGALSSNALAQDKASTSSPYELQATASQTTAPTPPPKQLGPLEVLLQLGRSPRALTAFGLEFTYAIIMAALEPT
ncbi:hypothetical protein QFC22_006565 [Naganishia vaughanmartiniae]|uniref:Uncharacterized protein n=1 Tax=Naganishia vaughanmartiniae TaxID=1424756 RepID=A0ACC2WHL3_9TREE|nr:hypothetical protein QFC22_006565 [Naganishia vaughanmartiniae]